MLQQKLTVPPLGRHTIRHASDYPKSHLNTIQPDFDPRLLNARHLDLDFAGGHAEALYISSRHTRNDL